MPAHGTYQVTSQEEGEAAEQDQSYRSCIIALLIFFFLCIILILGTWPWRQTKTATITDSENHNDSFNNAKYGAEESKTTTTKAPYDTLNDFSTNSNKRYDRIMSTKETMTMTPVKLNKTISNNNGVATTIGTLDGSVTNSSDINLTPTTTTTPLFSDGATYTAEAHVQSSTTTMSGGDSRTTTTDPLNESETEMNSSNENGTPTTTTKPLFSDGAIHNTEAHMQSSTTTMFGEDSGTTTTDSVTEFEAGMNSSNKNVTPATTTTPLFSDGAINNGEANVQSTTTTMFEEDSGITTTDSVTEFEAGMNSSNKNVTPATTTTPLFSDGATYTAETNVQSSTTTMFGEDSGTTTTDSLIESEIGMNSSNKNVTPATTTKPLFSDGDMHNAEAHMQSSTTTMFEEDSGTTTTDLLNESETEMNSSNENVTPATTTTPLFSDGAIHNTEAHMQSSTTTMFGEDSGITTTDSVTEFEAGMNSSNKNVTPATTTTPLFSDGAINNGEANVQSTTTTMFEEDSGTTTTDSVTEFEAGMNSSIKNVTPATTTTPLFSDGATYTAETNVQSTTTTMFGEDSGTTTTDPLIESETGMNSSNKNVTPTTTTTPLILKNVSNKICTTDSCKRLASKMFLYMNHSVKACDNFYEYACGGFEDDSEILERNLLNRVYQRIENEMRKKNNTESLLFRTYYNSCVNYDEAIVISERIQMAKTLLESIGKFYTPADQADDEPDITNLFTKLLMHHSALLFDIVPDVYERNAAVSDEYDNESSFTLKIGPPFGKSPFVLEDSHDHCNSDEETLLSDYVDLSSQYNSYIACKRDIKPIKKSIKESIATMVSDRSIENVTEFIDNIVMDIETNLIQGFLALYPPDNKLREAYVSKNYTRMKISDLESACDLLNWTALISSLTGKNDVRPDMELQVYFKEELIAGLERLKVVFTSNRNLTHLSNALLGLYARNLYQELIVPKLHNPKSHCLRVASSLMKLEASSLYMSSFTDKELEQMNSTITNMFQRLKYTLTLKIEKQEWIREDALHALLYKLKEMTIHVPDILYYENFTSLRLSLQYDQPSLTDNYFNNSISLMKQYRSNMYKMLSQNPKDPRTIWTHFAVPFETQAVSVYVLNTVIIPFGLIDWTVLPKDSENSKSFDYLIFATLGNVIAREIAHHFDTKGIYYYQNMRDEYTLVNGFPASLIIFQSYINCHNTSHTINVTLPSSNQMAKFNISELSLDERLSDVTGLRLAYETWAQTQSNDLELLPWLKLSTNQLFYLTFAQTHCKKLPLASPYIQDEHLPSRVRIFLLASSEKLLREAWNCSDSTIPSADTCPTFPNLKYEKPSNINMA